MAVVASIAGCGASEPPPRPPEPVSLPTARAPTEPSCRDIPECTAQGLCHAVDGRCLAVEAEDCSRSAMCAQAGACHIENGLCVARSRADCARAKVCRDAACDVVDGRCTPVACQCLGGRCSRRGVECVVAGDTDCVRSSAQRCFARYGQCVTKQKALEAVPSRSPK